jgi:uncharacterized iron-regulated membrane protein
MKAPKDINKNYFGAEMGAGIVGAFFLFATIGATVAWWRRRQWRRKTPEEAQAEEAQSAV